MSTSSLSYNPLVLAFLTGALLVVCLAAMVILSILFAKHRRQSESRRRTATSELRSVQHRIAQIVDQTPIVLFSFRPGRGFETCTDGISRLVPVTAVEVIANAESLRKAFAPQDQTHLGWMTGDLPCPAKVDWLGQGMPLSRNKEELPSRWLQIRAQTEISGDGIRILTGMILDVTETQQSKLELLALSEQLRGLANSLNTQREALYRHLAREFHDDLGQNLTSARLELLALTRILGHLNENQRATITRIEDALAQTHRNVKAITAELRPPVLDMGLAPAIEWLADNVLRPANIGLHLDISEVQELPDEVSICLFRILQESFSNCAKYSNASLVTTTFGIRANSLRLRIVDNGCGFDLESVDTGTHFGILGMRERTLALGGSFSVASSPGNGTEISLEIPQFKESEQT
jgi:signal transduction histidine kinase